MIRFWSIAALALCQSAWAADSLWQDDTSKSLPKILESGRTVTVNQDELTNAIQLAEPAAIGTQQRSTDTSNALQLPLPNGDFAQVSLIPTQVLAPEVAAENPTIQTWRVQSLDGKMVDGVADLSSQGLHVMLQMANGDTVFIDPDAQSSAGRYVSFSKKANPFSFKKDFRCQAIGHAEDHLILNGSKPAARAGETLRTYRLAVAATAEYTAANGGTKDSALAAITTTVNRVNLTYKRDLGIQLQLVSGTNLIYTDATTDPYTNSSASDMLAQNQTNIDSVIGNGNYDLGHVFATAGGGLAYVGVACNNTSKALGTTGIATPNGTAFDIDYVAHEMGHQLGATHTFNSTIGSCGGGNREAATAYEPGSGATIMAYSGLCGSDNLQTNSDNMFHAASISQIENYTHNTGGTGGAACGTVGAALSIPSVNAGGDYTIPARTPFILTGTGSDPAGAALQYSWEELDAGTSSTVGVDTGTNAIIRTHLPTTSPERTIPQLSDLTSSASSLGETLPATTRTLNFRLTARNGSGTAYDDMLVNVQNTGTAFAITTPTASTTLTAGQSLNVTWNVAGTNVAPINCSAVDIALTKDGGSTFTTLLANTANTGTATVTLPTTLGSSNRIRVKCTNNIFFALSGASPAVASTGSSQSSSGTTTTTSSSGGGGGGGSFPIEGLMTLGALAYWQSKRKKA